MLAMCPNVALGICALAVWGFLPVSSSEPCEAIQTIQIIQRVCKAENEAMVAAEDVQDHLKICSHLPSVLKCAVSTLPQCYDYIERTFEMYRHSPFSCELTRELVRELQEIILNKTQVTESSPVTESPTSSSPSESTTHSDHGLISTALNLSPSSTDKHSQKQTDETGAHNGHNEKHEGINNENGASVVVQSNFCAALLVLVSAKLLWRPAS